VGAKSIVISNLQIAQSGKPETGLPLCQAGFKKRRWQVYHEWTIRVLLKPLDKSRLENYNPFYTIQF
jgi:hypothetical protein